MGRAAEIQQIKYLGKRYPIRCSEIEQLYFDYVETTGRKDFIGFESTYLTKEIYIKAAIKAKKEGYEYMKCTISMRPPGYQILKLDDLIAGADFALIIYSHLFGKSIERIEMLKRYKGE